METRTIDLDGPVHYLVDERGTGPTFVCLHGLGGSHVNWLAVAARLAPQGRVFVPDLAGHGRTPLAGRSATVPANVRLVGRFLAEVVGGRAILVGNSMGGLIAMLATIASPERVAGLVLVNPSLPRAPGDRIDPEVARNFAAYAIPGVGERFIRRRKALLGPERFVADTLRLCTVDPSRVPRDVVAASVALARERQRMPWADHAFLQAARSILFLHAGRRSLEIVRRVPAVPTLLVHGGRDRLVPLTSAQQAARLRPDWTFEVLDDVGHVPQLEAPDRFMPIVQRWLDGPGGPAAEAAAGVAGA